MTIPLRFIEAKYEDIPDNIRASFEKMRETRKGLYLYGPVGTGKTHIVWALKKEIDEKCEINLKQSVGGPYCRVYNTTELLHDIRSKFGKDEGQDLLGDLMSCKDIIFFDDIGAEKITDWVLETFYLIINKRYENMIPTVFTSNLPITELAEKIGDRSASRVMEMCNVLDL